jgi:hypothetical protein
MTLVQLGLCLFLFVYSFGHIFGHISNMQKQNFSLTQVPNYLLWRVAFPAHYNDLLYIGFSL